MLRINPIVLFCIRKSQYGRYTTQSYFNYRWIDKTNSNQLKTISSQRNTRCTIMIILLCPLLLYRRDEDVFDILCNGIFHIFFFDTELSNFRFLLRELSWGLKTLEIDWDHLWEMKGSVPIFPSFGKSLECSTLYLLRDQFLTHNKESDPRSAPLLHAKLNDSN